MPLSDVWSTKWNEVLDKVWNPEFDKFWQGQITAEELGLPYEQVSVMVQGRMRLRVGDETREVGPGDMWFAPADMPHGGEILGEDPVIFIDVYAPPSRGDGSDVSYFE